MASKKRREIILDEAAALLAERGNNSFTMDEVAERVGVARVTVYRYFKSKKVLLTALRDERDVTLDQLALRETRDRILDAAGSVLENSGLKGATVYEIADQAGLGAATVYRHFGDRDGLMHAFVRERTPRRILATFDGKTERSVEEHLATVAIEIIQMIRDKREVLLLIASEHALRPDLVEVFVNAQKETTHTIHRFFARMVADGRFAEADPKDLVISFVGMVFSFAFFAPMLGFQLDDPHKCANHVARLFVHGALKGESAPAFRMDEHTGVQHDVP